MTIEETHEVSQTVTVLIKFNVAKRNQTDEEFKKAKPDLTRLRSMVILKKLDSTI